MDKWDRITNFNCDSCMFYVPKTENSGRCRRQAPTMKGFPVVYGNADWCGEHKIGSNPVRDGKENAILSERFRGYSYCEECKTFWNDPDGHICGENVQIKTCPKCQEKPERETCPAHFCTKCGTSWGYQPIINSCTPITLKDCPKCEEKPITKEDVRKVLDEPLTSPCFDQPWRPPGKDYASSPTLEKAAEKISKASFDFNKTHTDTDDNSKKETTVAIYPVDTKEKAEIKAEIDEQLWHIGDKATIPDKSTRVGTIQSSIVAIKELLEKL